MFSSNYVWAKVLNHIEERLTATIVSAWFDEAEVVELTEEQLVVYTPSAFSQDMISTRCASYIQEALKEIFNSDAKLVVFGKKELEAYRTRGKVPAVMDFNPQFSFDSFVVGPSNRFAHGAARAVSENPGQVYNPLFIYGPPGVGKTHLLYAIANAMRKADPYCNIVYIKGDQFTNELIDAIRNGKNMEFRSKYREADLFLIDDIQFIAGKSSTEEEFFNTFNALYEQNKQIVVTSDRPPKDILTLSERIKNRLESGLMADVNPPDFETRVGIIKSKSKQLGITIPENVVFYIAEQIKSNTRQLEGVVKKLQACININNENITIAVAQSFIKEVVRDMVPDPITIDRIIDEVSRTYSISKNEILSKSRNSDVALARQVAIYISWQVLNLSYTDIGRSFEKNHTTVLYTIKKMKEIMANDSYQKKLINDIISNLNN